jgi:hypothetical protein
MPRQVIQAAQITGPELVTQSPPEMLHEAHQLTTARERADAVARQYRFDDGFNEERLDAEISEGMRLSATGAMMVGRALMVWIDGAGKSIDWLVARYQLPRSTLFQHARIFRAMRERPALQELSLRTTQATILELLSCPPDDLDKVLAGDVTGLAPDDLEHLSRKELKARLKKLQIETHEELQGKEDLIAQQSETINRLKSWDTLPAIKKARTIYPDVEKATAAAMHAMETVINATKELLAALSDANGSKESITIQQNLRDLIDQLHRRDAQLPIVIVQRAD